MSKALYFYTTPKGFELRDEISIKTHFYYYNDLQIVTQELIGFYPMLF